jgi:hypothetical protein
MNFKHIRAGFLVITVLSLIFFLPTKSFSSNYSQTYTFHTKIGNFEMSHKLYVSVPLSLYSYYQKQNHNTFNIDDFSKFVTPDIFKSIAEDIQNVTGNIPHSDEAFANAVLEIVQQIPYNKTNVKFPAETIVNNSGDCDLLSLLAASIMKAGGLDVVLFFYEGSPVSHMNVGVHLLTDPVYHTMGIKPTDYEYGNKKYFSAETAGKGWKVGDQPQTYINTEPKIITLKNLSEASSTEISSSLDSPLIASSISLSLSPESLHVKEGEINITISGSISPRLSKQQVTVNIDHESYPPHIYRTVTDQQGNYSLTWNFNNTGTYFIQTSWNGIQNYAGSDSDILTVHIGLNQLLYQYETNETLRVGPEVIQTPVLNSYGYTILNYQKIKKIFEKNFTGTDFLLNSEFVIVGNGEPLLTEQKITIPSYEVQILRRRGIITKTIPEQTIIIPNYRQKLDNHIEFTLSQYGVRDYSVSIRLMDNSDMSQVIDKSDSTFINASKYVEENIWFNIEAKINENRAIVKLLDENNIRIAETIPNDHTNGTREIKILIKYDPDSIIVFKDLHAEILDQPTQLVEEEPPVDIPQTRHFTPPEPEEPPTPEASKPEDLIQEFALPTIITAIGFVSVVILVAIIFWAVRKRKYT